MKVNIYEIFKKNILWKYFGKNRAEYEAKYTKRERDMWSMTSWLIKDNYPQKIYDDNNPSDMEYLRGYHEIFMHVDNISHFTLADWFNYMKSQE